MPAGDLRRILSVILADEVGHARFGWTLRRRGGARLRRGERERLGAVPAARLRIAEEARARRAAARRALPRRGAAAFGLCNGREARELFYATVREVIIPRLKGTGCRAAAAWQARAAA